MAQTKTAEGKIAATQERRKIDEFTHHLLKHTHAFNDIQQRGERSRFSTVRDIVRKWRHQQKGKKVHVIEKKWREYMGPKGNSKRRAAKVAATMDPDTFDFHPTDANKHLEIRDQHGVVIAYRLRIPERFTKTLETSAHIIPKKKAKDSKRFRRTVNRHWALWKFYGNGHRGENKNPFMNSEFKRQRKKAERWFTENQALFDYLSNVLRLLNPYMYDKFKRAAEKLPAGTRTLCGVWAGCAINQFQDCDGNPHIDASDYAFGYNVVTGWGTFTSSRLLLWEAKQSIEMVPSDAVFFLGRAFTHNATKIVGGERNVVDCFFHADVIDWAMRQKGKDPRKPRPKWVAKTAEEPTWDVIEKGIYDTDDDDDDEGDAEGGDDLDDDDDDQGALEQLQRDFDSLAKI